MGTDAIAGGDFSGSAVDLYAGGEVGTYRTSYGFTQCHSSVLHSYLAAKRRHALCVELHGVMYHV